ncbi:MAG: RNA-binding S4 domain-containing protein [Clostridia bacterium]|nr:RNA-binding S4 domain-containing protein [Clostridia bacterium]
MRLDKFLKVSRIIKRRTVSNDACDAGRVEVNGKQAKAGYTVKKGDVIKIKFGERLLSFKVLFTEEKEAKMQNSPMAEEIL